MGVWLRDSLLIPTGGYVVPPPVYPFQQVTLRGEPICHFTARPGAGPLQHLPWCLVVRKVEEDTWIVFQNFLAPPWPLPLLLPLAFPGLVSRALVAIFTRVSAQLW